MLIVVILFYIPRLKIILKGLPYMLERAGLDVQQGQILCILRLGEKRHIV